MAILLPLSFQLPVHSEVSAAKETYYKVLRRVTEFKRDIKLNHLPGKRFINITAGSTQEVWKQCLFLGFHGEGEILYHKEAGLVNMWPILPDDQGWEAGYHDLRYMTRATLSLSRGCMIHWLMHDSLNMTVVSLRLLGGRYVRVCMHACWVCSCLIWSPIH